MDKSDARKQELKQEYRLRKPDMGVFGVMRSDGLRCLVEASHDLKSMINRTQFQLDAGFHPNRDLQRDWTQNGARGFEIRILEKLEYDEDESKTDYQDEIALLKAAWIDKLREQGVELF